MKHSFFGIVLVLAAFSLRPVWADHDHHHDDHPDLTIEADGSQLELHGDPISHNHGNFEFVDYFGSWQTHHGSNRWPGIGAEASTLPANSTADLIIMGGLSYWDGVSADGFQPTSGMTHLSIQAASGTTEYKVYGNSTEQRLSGFISVVSSGGVHMHPIWQLFGNSDPADGAYFIEVSVDAANYLQSNVQGLLFHKGMDYDTYEAAVDLLLGDDHDDDHDHDHGAPVSEPTGLVLLALGAPGLLRRRRRS